MRRLITFAYTKRLEGGAAIGALYKEKDNAGVPLVPFHVRFDAAHHRLNLLDIALTDTRSVSTRRCSADGTGGLHIPSPALFRKSVHCEVAAW
jgi:hypothetical protein